MAKTNKETAESKTTQPAPVREAPRAAPGNGRQADDTGPQSNGDEGLMAFAMQEAGIGESDEAPRTARKPKASNPKPDDIDDDAPAAAEHEPSDDPEDPDEPESLGDLGEDEPAAAGDGAVEIPDEDDGTGTGGTGEDDENPKGERRLSDLPEWAQQEIRDKIKLREQRRELRATLDAKDKELAEVRKKLEGAAVGYTATAPGFEEFKTPEDIDGLRVRLSANVEWAEDNEDGWSGEIQGQPVEYTRQQMREFRRKTLKQIEAADKAKTILNQNLARAKESEEKARKLYPSFLDPRSARSNLLLDAARDYPELNASPSKALLLAKVAVAGLLESGQFKLVKVDKPRGPTAQPATAARTQPSAPKPPPVPAPPRPAAPPSDDLAARMRSGDARALEEWANLVVGE